jgi:hypothetical protein
LSSEDFPATEQTHVLFAAAHMLADLAGEMGVHLDPEHPQAVQAVLLENAMAIFLAENALDLSVTLEVATRHIGVSATQFRGRLDRQGETVT